MAASPLTFVHRLEPEDRARADFYGVLAALYADAPERAPAAGDRATPSRCPMPRPARCRTPGTGLREACGAMDPEAAQQEYWDLFVGTGKSEINLHASHWLTGFMMEKPLVELRTTLARLGLSRKAESELVEDHVSALFEAMRLLIEGLGDRRPSPIEEQQAFFERHIAGWVPDLCTALTQSPLANFYRPVGEFTKLFVAIERDSLAIG